LERELVVEVIKETIVLSEQRDRKLANMVVEELALALTR